MRRRREAIRREAVDDDDPDDELGGQAESKARGRLPRALTKDAKEGTEAERFDREEEEGRAVEVRSRPAAIGGWDGEAGRDGEVGLGRGEGEEQKEGEEGGPWRWHRARGSD